jgi:hypothetical protein
MSVHVVAVDDQTGEREEVDIPDGDYLLICVRPSHLTHTQAHANGTHVLTVKGNRVREVVS